MEDVWKLEEVMGWTLRKAPMAPRNPSCLRNSAAISPYMYPQTDTACQGLKKERNRTAHAHPKTNSIQHKTGRHPKPSLAAPSREYRIRRRNKKVPKMTSSFSSFAFF